MATNTPAVWSFIKATPYSAVYGIAGGALAILPAVLDFSDAPTFAQLVPGPLKTEIKRRLGTLQHANLNEKSERLRVYTVSGQVAAESPSLNHTIAWVANGISGTVSDEGAGDLLLEIRFVHSKKR
jgi:hypothetical protein